MQEQQLDIAKRVSIYVIYPPVDKPVMTYLALNESNAENFVCFSHLMSRRMIQV